MESILLQKPRKNSWINSVNSEIVEIMDEMLDEIGNTNRSRYIEKLIREDLEKRGKNIERDF